MQERFVVGKAFLFKNLMSGGVENHTGREFLATIIRTK